MGRPLQDEGANNALTCTCKQCVDWRYAVERTQLEFDKYADYNGFQPTEWVEGMKRHWSNRLSEVISKRPEHN